MIYRFYILIFGHNIADAVKDVFWTVGEVCQILFGGDIPWVRL